MICTDYCLAGPKINKVSPMFFMTLLLTRAISKVCNEAHDDFVRRAQKRIPSGAARPSELVAAQVGTRRSIPADFSRFAQISILRFFVRFNGNAG
jgi:hypothetical protein